MYSRLGDGQRLYRKADFGSHLECCAAGHNQVELRAGDEKLADKRGPRQDLFEVVQHEQQVEPPQVRNQQVARTEATVFVEAERPRNSCGDESLIPDGRQVDEHCSV